MDADYPPKWVIIACRFTLYSMGQDGQSKTNLNAKESLDDIVRANNGSFIGLASDF